MIKNRIVNGGFETGTLSPFIVNNPSFVSINSSNSHSGVYSATLSGGLTTAIIAQAVPVSPNETFELFVSLSKIGPFPSPLIAINVQYYNGNTFLGDGLVTFIHSNRIPDNIEKDWLEVYGTTSPVPATANTASIVIAKFPALGSADVFIDDISLLSVESTGTLSIAFGQFWGVSFGNAAPGGPFTFPFVGPTAGGVSLLDSFTVGITQAGVYQISFIAAIFVSEFDTFPQFPSLSIFLNDNPIPATQATFGLILEHKEASGCHQITGECLLLVPANSTIQLINDTSAVLSLCGGVTNPIELTVIKLN